jgi:hypothetical protein
MYEKTKANPNYKIWGEILEKIRAIPIIAQVKTALDCTLLLGWAGSKRKRNLLSALKAYG